MVGLAIVTGGTHAEGIDPSGVADALAVLTPFDGRTVVIINRFEFVADIPRGVVGGVERIRPTVLA